MRHPVLGVGVEVDVCTILRIPPAAIVQVVEGTFGLATDTGPSVSHRVNVYPEAGFAVMLYFPGFFDSISPSLRLEPSNVMLPVFAGTVANLMITNIGVGVTTCTVSVGKIE